MTACVVGPCWSLAGAASAERRDWPEGKYRNLVPGARQLWQKMLAAAVLAAETRVGRRSAAARCGAIRLPSL